MGCSLKAIADDEADELRDAEAAWRATPEGKTAHNRAIRARDILIELTNESISNLSIRDIHFIQGHKRPNTYDMDAGEGYGSHRDPVKEEHLAALWKLRDKQTYCSNSHE